MKLVVYLSALFFLLLNALSCSRDIRGPLVVQGAAPGQVSNVRVENLPGAARISYTLPRDSNILYVVAKVKLLNGEEQIFKSSVFKNFVVVEGFLAEREYEVQLQTVSRAELYSEPVKVKVNPLRAPVNVLYDSLKVGTTYGGVNIRYKNEFNEEFSVVTLLDSAGTWIEIDRHYSSLLDENFSVRRGFDSVPTNFAFYIIDKWQNKSDTLKKTITPIFEVEFDKALWSNAKVDDDTWESIIYYQSIENLWTPGATVLFAQNSQRVPPLVIPNWFTIDLGRQYNFGRMLVTPVNHHPSFMYARGTPEIFEIWAGNEKTTDWSKWDLLGSYTIVKPSGLPLGSQDATDIAKIQAGFEFGFDFKPQNYRYVRFKTLKTFGNENWMWLLELTLYGSPAK